MLFTNSSTTAALWNAAVKSLNKGGYIVTEAEEDVENRIKTNKNKIRREKKKFAANEKARLEKDNKKGVECIGTDGKRDKKTLKKVVVVVNGEEVEKREKGLFS